MKLRAIFPSIFLLNPITFLKLKFIFMLIKVAKYEGDDIKTCIFEVGFYRLIAVRISSIWRILPVKHGAME